uniref:Uncharacterized protein n=1 Tax=Cacopsylla melanoneura TaxID=428564 RepID=A0A8D9BXE7_9HEMI
MYMCKSEELRVNSFFAEHRPFILGIIPSTRLTSSSFIFTKYARVNKKEKNVALARFSKNSCDESYYTATFGKYYADINTVLPPVFLIFSNKNFNKIISSPREKEKKTKTVSNLLPLTHSGLMCSERNVIGIMFSKIIKRLPSLILYLQK